MELIDAHHHLWPADVIKDQTWRPPDDQALRRSFDWSDLEPQLNAAKVSGTILMQSIDAEDENRRIMDYARRTDRILGIVAWAPLTRPSEAATAIERLCQSDSPAPIVGVRCLTGREDLDWATTSDGLDNFRRLADHQLAWDVVPVTTAQVRAVTTVARAVPSLRIIVDHLARPPLNADGFGTWTDTITALADQPSIAIKLSVGVDALASWQRWDAQILRPYVETAVHQFGSERAMIASNWPVVLLRTNYDHAISDVTDIVGGMLTDSQLTAVASGTARRWYGLKVQSRSSDETV